jgi:FHA domain
MPDVSYVPGGLIAVAGDRCLAVVEAAADAAVTKWIWQRATAGTSAEALLAGLLGSGFEGVGGFALLADLAAKQRRLFCRGAVAATVDGGNVSARIDGVGLLTWREYAVAPDAERIVLGDPPDESVLRLPAAAGVLLASCVIIDLTSAASRDTLLFDSPVRFDSSVGGYYDSPVGGYHDSPVADTAPPAVEAVAQPEIAPAVEAAAQSEIVDTARPAVPDDLALAVSKRPRAPVGLIDAVQWGPGPGPEAAPMPAAGRGDDGFTVKRTELSAPVGAEVESEPAALSTTRVDWTGPLVPALVCPAGHVNPPSEADCRKCGATLPNDSVVAPRPALGVLRLSTGDVVTLDRGVVIGRSPRTDFADVAGRQRPHAVSLPSAGGDISRTHLRVTLDGWHVLVTDLDSTNGTLVALPGRDPEQLRPGEPVPIRPGTVVTLADGIDFRYEADE